MKTIHVRSTSFVFIWVGWKYFFRKFAWQISQSKRPGHIASWAYGSADIGCIHIDWKEQELNGHKELPSV